MNDALNMDNSKPDDYIEEMTDANGHKVKKHVTKGPGWQSVEIESEGPMDIGSVGGLIGQMMQ